MTPSPTADAPRTPLFLVPEDSAEDPMRGDDPPPPPKTTTETRGPHPHSAAPPAAAASKPRPGLR